MFNSKEERLEHFLIACESSGFHISEEFQKWLWDNNFFTAPASTKYHGAYEGGLFDHCFAVYYRLQELTAKLGLEWQRPESPFIVGMFHDLCKCDQYTKVTDDSEYVHEGKMLVAKEKYHYEYNTNTLLKGHGAKSVMFLSQFITLTEEEMLCIRYHMGAYGNEDEQKSEWAGFDKAIRKTKGLCLWANTADMLASKVDGI